MHYARWRRYGDASTRKTAANGDVLKYYREVVLPYDGTDCLIWPFSCDRNGYAKAWVDGKCCIVSRMLCEDVNGPPPSPEYHAAHACHQGAYGCVTKGHLEWQTPQENLADMPSLTRDEAGRWASAAIESAGPAGGKIFSLAAVR